MMRPLFITLLLAGVCTPAFAQDHTGMVEVPAGLYAPFFQPNPGKGKVPVSSKPVPVDGFWLDISPVTNADYLAFVTAHPEWQKSKVKPLFAEKDYLKFWSGDLTFAKPQMANQPVTDVSWFGALAYCKAKGKTLPSTEQWEYALQDLGRNRAEIDARSIDWFGAPNPAQLPEVGQTPANGFGVKDMVGLVWEWTADFNSFMTGTELRNTDSKDNAQFCGNGSTGVKDNADYPGFMRYSLRTSLKATYTTDNVGFRCAGD